MALVFRASLTYSPEPIEEHRGRGGTCFPERRLPENPPPGSVLSGAHRTHGRFRQCWRFGHASPNAPVVRIGKSGLIGSSPAATLGPKRGSGDFAQPRDRERPNGPYHRYEYVHPMASRTVTRRTAQVQQHIRRDATRNDIGYTGERGDQGISTQRNRTVLRHRRQVGNSSETC